MLWLNVLFEKRKVKILHQWLQKMEEYTYLNTLYDIYYDSRPIRRAFLKSQPEHALTLYAVDTINNIRTHVKHPV